MQSQIYRLMRHRIFREILRDKNVGEKIKEHKLLTSKIPYSQQLYNINGLEKYKVIKTHNVERESIKQWLKRKYLIFIP